MIGYIILGLIIVPLFALMVASIAESPISAKVGTMFTVVFLIQVIGMVASFVVLQFVFGLIVP